MNTDSIITINENAIEPNEYFKILKNQLVKATEKKLQGQLTYVAEQLIAAKKAGQEEFLKRLSFTYQTIKKEQICLANGIDQFVYRNDIKRFIDKIQPKHSVKIIELSRYHRAIPLGILNRIKEVKDLELFDDYCIVYTDFTNEAVLRTEQEKELIEKNRDPILFGYYKNDNAALKHDRFYFIVDWIDEYCELTFTQMLEVLGDKPKTIDIDTEYLNEIIKGTMMNIQERTNFNFITTTAVVPTPTTVPQPKLTWWQKIIRI